VELLHHRIVHLGRLGRAPHLMTRADWLHTAAVAAALFVLYALTAPHTVGLEDDALFILSSYFLGIEHPPGYPLFTLIGHLFCYLPFGSAAYRVHLVSALFGALSAAAAWLCARQLGLGRLPAYLAAFALGVSPVFWSQAIIAEVYTLNTFFFLVLVYLALKACPPAPHGAVATQPRLLPWFALLFGLSLSNHWPLMLLVAPGFAIVLWPLRAEILKRAGLLAGLAALGLLPYVWMVARSFAPLPISFAGPLETLTEVWSFVSRAGYADVDHSPSADWLDRVKFFRFFAGELVFQLALVGTALAVVGFAVQWRRLGRRGGAFLTVAFLMPSVVLLLLLGFDYSAITKHVFHVYPLPAYAIAALWLGLGFAWLVERYALRALPAGTLVLAVLGLVFAVGARNNLFTDHEWGARYARTLLDVLPPNAVVFARDEADLGPLAYFLMIENQRPDVMLYATKGLVLGNRLFKPTATDEATRQRILREAIERETNPVVFTLESFSGYAVTDRWLYIAVDKSSRDPLKVTVDVPAEAIEFFERHVAEPDLANAWVGFFQGQLRRRYGETLGNALARDRAPDTRTRRHLDLLMKDFYGVLGIVEGLMRNPGGYSAGEVGRLLDRARQVMPSDVSKDELARFFHLRAALRAHLGDEAGAVRDFETALSVWPAADNWAIKPLEDLYAKRQETAALEALRARFKRPPRHQR
jgi:hypothetical protein